MLLNSDGEENIIQQLKSAIQSIIKSTGANNRFTKEITEKIQNLQHTFDALPAIEKTEFLNKIRETFQSTIENIESKVRQTVNFERVYHHSIIAALIFIFICITILYIYKMFKVATHVSGFDEATTSKKVKTKTKNSKNHSE